MPSIAQQDYKIIAPKQGRTFFQDAAALGELKKAILNGIGFDCIIKDSLTNEGDYNRVLGFYPDGSTAEAWAAGNSEAITIGMPNTVAQYQGLAAVQEAEDVLMGSPVNSLPSLTDNNEFLYEEEKGVYICVNDYALSFTTDDNDHLASLEISTTKRTSGFVNITWEDAQKLIGLPIE